MIAPHGISNMIDLPFLISSEYSLYEVSIGGINVHGLKNVKLGVICNEHNLKHETTLIGRNEIAKKECLLKSLLNKQM